MCLKNLFKKPEPEKPFEYGDNCLLHFAINDYYGTESDLRGCLDDQEDLINYTDGRIGGVSFRSIQNKDVTISSFEGEVRKAYAAMPRGLLTIGYSGHGTPERDASESDGYREALYLANGSYSDKRLVQLISEKPQELELVLFLDCCFSKGMFRDFVTGNPKYKKSRFLITEPMPEQFHYIRSATREAGNFLLLSACAERQTAADAQFNGRYNGAFTFYAVHTMQKGITYRQWMERIWQYLPGDDFEQIPGIDGPERMFDMKIFEHETFL